MNYESLFSVPRGEPRLELGAHVFGPMWKGHYLMNSKIIWKGDYLMNPKIIWNSLDNAPSSIVFYLEMEMEVEVGVHDIRSRFTQTIYSSISFLLLLSRYNYLKWKNIYVSYLNAVFLFVIGKKFRLHISLVS